jgi:prepilin-type N-terminal cleavage/methylation domain-containing protein
MKMSSVKRVKHSGTNEGFSLPELAIVLIVIAIIVVLALPQIISSRRLTRFAELQKQVSASLTEARQEAVRQKRPIAMRYDDNKKQLILYGGSFGVVGDVNNKITALTDSGLSPNEIKYGRPPSISNSALGDTTNMTALSDGKVDIMFQPDGSVVDARNNPQNNALFFYPSTNRTDAAFAISILGAGGRIKVWRYSKTVSSYIE